MVWIGFVRPIAGYLLLAPCGPVWSKLSASEITLPFLTSLVAAMMSSGLVKLSVPISSFGPHLPQFLYFSAASRRSWRVIFRAGIGFLSDGRGAHGWRAEIQPARGRDASPTGNGRAQCYDAKKRGGIHALDHEKLGLCRAVCGDYRHRAGRGRRISRKVGKG